MSSSVIIERLEIDTELVCRVCITQKSDDAMISIFDRDPNGLYIYEKIEKCSGIKILNSPELPNKICKKCETFLRLAYQFRSICRNSDNYLREYVCCKFDGNGSPENIGNAEYLIEYTPIQMQENNNTTEDEESQDVDTAVESQDSVDAETLNDYTTLWLQHETANDLIVEERDENVDNITAATDENLEKVIPKLVKNIDIEDDNVKTIETTDIKSVIVRKPRIRAKTERQTNKQKKTQPKQIHFCDICGNTYPRKYALEAHMRRHRNERPFECEICHEAFHLNFQLTRHIRKHTGDRPYTCQYCQRSFADRSTLSKHERVHRNERPFSCKICGKSFTYSSVLKVHQQTHTGEKPFSCGICNKRFARSHHLRAHLETLLHQNDPRSKTLLKQIKKEEQNENITKDEYVTFS